MTDLRPFPRWYHGRLPTPAHHCAWPVLRGCRRWSYGGFVGTEARLTGGPIILGTSNAPQARTRALTHYVRNACLVWYRGHPITFGARYWCGAMSPQVRLLAEPTDRICRQCSCRLAAHLEEG